MTNLIHGLKLIPDLGAMPIHEREGWLHSLNLSWDHHELSPRKRQRNILHRGTDFELVLVNWGEGSGTPVHDHGGSQCSYMVLEGEILERLFRPKTTFEKKQTRHTRGAVASLIDSEHYHSMEAPTPALSLHIYARPLGLFNQFDSATANWLVADAAKL